ncbi:MAG TPA: hypothetical protein VKE74_21640 [Gemmataceae bacterium]|nr:hypothetical protein [Gemmataceae bacterium]
MRSSVNCPFCDARLAPEELAEGWCETCGKKLPPRTRRQAHPSPREPAPTALASGLRTGLGILGILVGLLCLVVGLSHLPNILRVGGTDPARAAGRLTAAVCFCGLPFGLGLYALLKKGRPRQ